MYLAKCGVALMGAVMVLVSCGPDTPPPSSTGFDEAKARLDLRAEEWQETQDAMDFLIEDYNRRAAEAAGN